MSCWNNADECVALSRQMGWQDSPEDKDSKDPIRYLLEEEEEELAELSFQNHEEAVDGEDKPETKSLKLKRGDVQNPLGSLLI